MLPSLVVSVVTARLLIEKSNSSLERNFTLGTEALEVPSIRVEPSEIGVWLDSMVSSPMEIVNGFPSSSLAKRHSRPPITPLLVTVLSLELSIVKVLSFRRTMKSSESTSESLRRENAVKSRFPVVIPLALALN